MFNSWCQNEGVIAPKITFPAYFGKNCEIVGVEFNAQIQNREAFLFIPYRMMITID